MKTGRKNRVIEFFFHSKEKINQPKDISLSAVFISPSGRIKKVPTFYDGGNVWKVRYSSEEPGIHEFATDSKPKIKGLSGFKVRCQIFIDREKNPFNHTITTHPTQFFAH